MFGGRESERRAWRRARVSFAVMWSFCSSGEKYPPNSSVGVTAPHRQSLASVARRKRWGEEGS